MNSFNTISSNITNINSINIDKAYNNNLYTNTGLYGEILWDNGTTFYEGYPAYYIVNTIDGSCNITNLDNITNAVLPLAKQVNSAYTLTTLSNTNNQSYHCQWTGYFKSDYTGTWTFSLLTNNFSALWIDDVAISTYARDGTTQNFLLTDSGSDTLTSSATVALINKKYYPIRITWGKRYDTTDPFFKLSVTRNGTTINNLTNYLYSANPNASTLIGIPKVFIKTTANTSDNLYTPKLFIQYSEVGYHSNVVDFVQNNPIYNGVVLGPAYVANIGSMNEASTTLGFTIPTGNGVHNYFSILYTGYFKADFTGTFTFNQLTDDETYLWIGNTAITGYTTSNYLVKSASDSITRSGSISLVNGTYYPIRILYGQYTGPGYHTFTFTRNGTTITNWTGYTFHPITPTTGNPKMFI